MAAPLTQGERGNNYASPSLPEKNRTDAPSIDWGEVHRRLDRLGVRCFQMEKLPAGCRVICLVPSSAMGHQQRFESQAASEAEAVRLMLEQAEQWAARR